MGDDRADGLHAVELADLLVEVALADWEAAGGTKRLAMRPSHSRDDSAFNHDSRIRMAAALNEPLTYRGLRNGNLHPRTHFSMKS